jgi:hypothetical protein
MRKSNLYASLIFILVFFSVNSAAATTVFVSPEKTLDLNKDETFTTNVEIKDVANLYSFQFYLKYDPSVLYPIGGDGDIKVNFLDDSLDPYKGSYVDNENGFLFLYSTYTADVEPKSGGGVLGSITFKVVREGTSTLHLYDIILFDGSKIIQCSSNDGYFDNSGNGGTTLTTITTPTTTPTSGSQWSNLKYEPSIVTPQNPVNIFVDWYNPAGLKTVIISENSTGKWVKHTVYGG